MMRRSASSPPRRPAHAGSSMQVLWPQPRALGSRVPRGFPRTAALQAPWPAIAGASTPALPALPRGWRGRRRNASRVHFKNAQLRLGFHLSQRPLGESRTNSARSHHGARELDQIGVDRLGNLARVKAACSRIDESVHLGKINFTNGWPGFAPLSAQRRRPSRLCKRLPAGSKQRAFLKEAPLGRVLRWRRQNRCGPAFGNGIRIGIRLPYRLRSWC